MKSVLTVLFFSIPLSFHSASYASNKSEQKPTNIPEFPIYAEINKTNLVEKANLSTPLVRIFKQDNWIKVADTSNGLVGWVKSDDYKKAIEAWNKPRTQSVLLNITEKESPELHKVEIVAYKNGKKLEDKEAKAIYEQFKKQQATRDQVMRQWFNAMNELFNKTHQTTFLSTPFFEPFPLIQPVLIVEKKSSAKNKNAKKGTREETHEVKPINN
jgi:hypothetical protein